MIKYSILFFCFIFFSSHSNSRTLVKKIYLNSIEISKSGEYHYKFSDETEIKDKSAAIAVLLLSWYLIQDLPNAESKNSSNQLITNKSEQLRWLRYFMNQIVEYEKQHPLYEYLKNLSWMNKTNEISYAEIINADLGYKLNQFKKDKKVFIKFSKNSDFKPGLLSENNVKNQVGLLFLTMNFDSKNTESWRARIKIELPPELLPLKFKN